MEITLRPGHFTAPMRVCSQSCGGAAVKSQGRQPLVDRGEPSPPSLPSSPAGATVTPVAPAGLSQGERGAGTVPGADAPGSSPPPPFGGSDPFRSRVGGRRGTSQTPFSIRPPPNRTCKFPSLRLSSGRILRRSGRWAPLTGGYDRVPNPIPGISPPGLPTAPVRLPPFALWPALPAADSYGGSVTLGLAPRRRSRASPIQYVRARVRPPIHPYARRDSSVSRPVGLHPGSVQRDVPGGPTWSQLGEGP